MAKTKITGEIVSKTDMTATVVSEFKVKHPKYLKSIRKTKKFLVHDGQNIAVVGARAEIIETKPISKNKHFEIVRIIEAK